MKKMILTACAALLLGGSVQGQPMRHMSGMMGSKMPVGHSSVQAGVMVSGAYVAAQPPVATDSAAFMTIRNVGKKPLVLISGASTAASSATLMDFVRLNNGQMSMKMLRSLSIAPGQSLSLTPGSKHLMLVGLKQPLKEGVGVPISLHFASGVLNITAPVKKF